MTYTPPPWNYQGHELRPYEGRPDANQHMQYGSRRGKGIVPYATPKPQCVGALVDNKNLAR